MTTLMSPRPPVLPPGIRVGRRVIWANVRTAPHRWMAAWLRRRGWVCFYLEDAARTCHSGVCWLALYQADERRRRVHGD